MPPARLIPEKSELRQMIARGMTHEQIAEHVYETTGTRVTRGAVSSAISRAGLSQPAQRYKDQLPWRVKIEHSKHYAARMLRLLGRRQNGEDLHPDDESRLDSWIQKLDEDRAVVAYIPETAEGFHYVDPPKGYRRGAAPIIVQEIRLDDIRAGRIRW